MYKITDRIELIEMPNDPNPIKQGEKGTIVNISTIGNEIILSWLRKEDPVLQLGDEFPELVP